MSSVYWAPIFGCTYIFNGDMMKILDSMWFINCGIVRVQTDYEGIRYYIRGIQSNEWSTPEKDAELIADWGSSFPDSVGDVLFGISA